MLEQYERSSDSESGRRWVGNGPGWKPGWAWVGAQDGVLPGPLYYPRTKQLTRVPLTPEFKFTHIGVRHCGTSESTGTATDWRNLATSGIVPACQDSKKFKFALGGAFANSARQINRKLIKSDID